MTLGCLTTDAIHGINLGYDAQGLLPDINPDAFDLLLTTSSDPPRPWVGVKCGEEVRLAASINSQPHAAMILARILRMGEGLSFADALEMESLAYSTLLGSARFKRWLSARGEMVTPAISTPPLHIDREGDQMTLALSDPKNRNAISAIMRDALWEVLANALDDPSKPEVLIKAEGACFSTGGALWEFGTAQDLAEAHAIRMARNCAALIHRLGDKCTVNLHGACIGSGIEIAAAAHHRIARKGSWFQLPELAMGLIPGAGGTVSIARAIGRHRACWLMLSGKRLNAKKALDWGLVHELVP